MRTGRPVRTRFLSSHPLVRRVPGWGITDTHTHPRGVSVPESPLLRPSRDQSVIGVTSTRLWAPGARLSPAPTHTPTDCYTRGHYSCYYSTTPPPPPPPGRRQTHCSYHVQSGDVKIRVKRRIKCVCNVPDPATPTVAAPAPMNLAAESMSRLAGEVWKDRTWGRRATGFVFWATRAWLWHTTALLNGRR